MLFSKRNRPPSFMLVLFVLTYAFTVWQARWAYFIVVALVMLLPAGRLRSQETQPLLAPWGLSPSISYWSGQPAVAGSSHESLSGIAASARFF